DTARGSLAEVETIIEMARELGYMQPADFGRLEALVNETGKTLYGLLRKISGAAARIPSVQNLTSARRLGPSASTSTSHCLGQSNSGHEHRLRRSSCGSGPCRDGSVS